MSKNFTEVLDGVGNYMSDVYHGNHQYRWGETPYMDATKANEDILAHQYSCLRLANLLKISFPALEKALNWEVVYETIMGHDDGEIEDGDISAVSQLGGAGANKTDRERQIIRSMAAGLPAEVKDEMIHRFDEFEQPAEKMTSPEILFAKFVDHYQGNHFALTNGTNLPKHSDLISRIVNKHFVPYATRLIDVLRESGKNEAGEEIRQIFRHHIGQIQNTGITLNTSTFEHLLKD